MNTRTVRQEVVWAVLAMEAALATPVMSIIAVGEGAARLAMTALLVLLLPTGFVALQRFSALRDAAWRVLVGFGLVVLLRLPAPVPPGDGAAAAMGRFLQALIPAGLAFALWWRGGSFADLELTAADVQLEFMLGSCVLLLMLLVFHGLVAVDPGVLVFAAALFAASGLVALGLARQDAAQAATQGGSRPFGGVHARLLGVLVGALPILLAMALLSVARPEVMAAVWLGLGNLLALLIMPILLVLSWLASLLPAAVPPTGVRPPPRPLQPPPDIDALARQQQPPDWIPWLALTLVLVMVLFMAAGILRLLLETEVVIHPRAPRTEDTTGATVESTGDARQDLRQLLRWLAALFRRRAAGRGVAASTVSNAAAEDAWTAYRALLEWAAQHGIRRTASETTQQLQTRLLALDPASADVVRAVTTTYEQERYGSAHAAHDLLRRLRQAVASLRPVQR